MNQTEFDQLTEKLHTLRRGTIDAKRKQYSGGKDVLENFRWVAFVENRQPEEVILSYMLKHVQAIAKAVQAGTLNADWETQDGAEGDLQKLGDIMNYCELLAARAAELVYAEREWCTKCSDNGYTLVMDASGQITKVPCPHCQAVADDCGPGGCPIGEAMGRAQET